MQNRLQFLQIHLHTSITGITSCSIAFNPSAAGVFGSIMATLGWLYLPCSISVAKLLKTRQTAKHFRTKAAASPTSTTETGNSHDKILTRKHPAQKRCRPARRNGPPCPAKHAISQCRTAHFAPSNHPNTQANDYQLHTQTSTQRAKKRKILTHRSAKWPCAQLQPDHGKTEPSYNGAAK